MTSAYQKLALAAVGVTITVLGIGRVAQAAVLTFDDIAPISNLANFPESYGGLNWENFGYRNGSDSGVSRTGYDNGRVSGDYVSFNNNGNLAVVSDSVFDFNSAYLTAAWNDGLSVTVEGLNNGATLYSKTVIVDTTKPTQVNFDYFGVDKLRFTSSGGVEPDYLKEVGNGTQFALDNFTFNKIRVPEPTSVSGVLTAVGIGIAFKRKLKQKSI